MRKTMLSAREGKVAVSYMEAFGKMQFTLTNDYLFRAMLQKNKKALKGLICAILGLHPEEVLSVEITNPVELGESIEAKDFLLDIRVLLNNDTIVNMEMQVLNLGNWTERSMIYLCRSFDNINRGQNYLEIKPVIQVCFLDFTLFDEYPEFFSTYMFVNVKNHIIYSDKLKLFVIDLTKIDDATEEDKERGIDHWARLFKANTWEEVKMLTENNDFMKEAAETAYRLSAEEKIRLQCQAREDFYREQFTVKAMLNQQERELAWGKEKIADQERELAWGKEKIADQERELAWGKEKIADQEKELAWGKEKIADQERELAWGKEKIADQERELAWGKEKIADQERELAWGKEKIADQERELAWGKEKIADQERELAQEREKIADQESELALKNAEIARLMERIAELEK